MKDIKQVFYFLKDTFKPYLGMVILVFLLGDIIQLLIAYQLKNNPYYGISSLCVHGYQIGILIVALGMWGFTCGSKMFDGYIRIVAKRGCYIRSNLLQMLGLSIGSVLVNRVISVLVKGIGDLLSLHSEAYIQLSWMREWSLFISVIAIGWYLGTCFYRSRWMGLLSMVIVAHVLIKGWQMGMLSAFIFQGTNMVVKVLLIAGLAFIAGSALLYRASINKSSGEMMR